MRGQFPPRHHPSGSRIPDPGSSVPSAGSSISDSLRRVQQQAGFIPVPSRSGQSTARSFPAGRLVGLLFPSLPEASGRRPLPYATITELAFDRSPGIGRALHLPQDGFVGLRFRIKSLMQLRTSCCCVSLRQGTASCSHGLVGLQFRLKHLFRQHFPIEARIR